jgi:hypothetical protein
MLYFSSGSECRGLSGGACPEAMGTKNSENRQVRTLAFNVLEWIIIRNPCVDAPGITGNAHRRQGKKRTQPKIDRISHPLSPLVLMRLNHVARFIEYVNYGVLRPVRLKKQFISFAATNFCFTLFS